MSEEVRKIRFDEKEPEADGIDVHLVGSGGLSRTWLKLRGQPGKEYLELKFTEVVQLREDRKPRTWRMIVHGVITETTKESDEKVGEVPASEG